jgi:sigma-B regulation protein RsbU (phosphoserine phosphatase)
MREHINTWDQTEFVRDLNKSFRGCVTRGKYATAVILGIIRGSGETAFTSAGHLPPLWYQSEAKIWRWLDEDVCAGRCGVEGLPVGLIPGTTYRQTRLQFQPNDILILYSDGITEAQDGFGDMLGRDRLMSWARMAPVDDPLTTGEFLLDRLCRFRRNYVSDDETIIAIQRSDRS